MYLRLTGGKAVVALWTHTSRFQCNGIGDLWFRCQLSTSTRTTTHLLEKYLIDSLGFSKKAAAFTSSKVTTWKPRKPPDFVINFLKQTGFDMTQIRKMVSRSPSLLSCDVSKTLKPKLQCLMDLGLSGPDLVNVFAKDPTIFGRSLDTHLRPTIDCLRRILGSDENVVKAIGKSAWLLSFGDHHRMETNVMLFRNYGFSDVKIQKILLRNPSRVTLRPEWIKNLLNRLEKDFNVPLDSPSFLYGFHALAGQKKSILERKIEIFKSFGWSNDHIFTMFRKLPCCMHHSEIRIQKELNLYMKELGFAPDYLASHPAIFAYSLEKRVAPRMRVPKILDEKKLERRKLALYAVLGLTESKFIEYFVLPYKDQIPNLYEPFEKTLDPK